MDDKNLFTITEAAEALGVKPRQIRRKAQAGQLERVDVDGQRLYQIPGMTRTGPKTGPTPIEDRSQELNCILEAPFSRTILEGGLCASISFRTRKVHLAFRKGLPNLLECGDRVEVPLPLT